KYQAAARISGSSSWLKISGAVHQCGRSNSSRTMRSFALIAEEFSDFNSWSSQRAKPETGDNVTNVVSFGSSRQISSTTCLIRKLPKETPDNPRRQFEME